MLYFIKLKGMKKTHYILFICFFLLTSLSYSQKGVNKTKLTDIQGTAVGSKAETQEQVYNRAISNAKVNALQEAGVEENIVSGADWYKYENEENFEEMFASNVFSDIRGSVVDVVVTSDNRSFVENNQMKIDLTISCTVLKYEKTKDLGFDAWINGIEQFYKSGDQLRYSVKVSKEAYLKVFAFTKYETFPIFPSEYEADFKLEPNKVYAFPLNSLLFEYELSTDKKKDPHRLLFILLKEDYPYTGEITYKDIANWIFTIPPDMRIIKTQTFELVSD